MNGTDCPPPDCLSDLLHGRLDAERASELEEHVGECPRCQRVVDSLVNGLPLTGTIRSSSAPPAVESEIPGGLVARLDDLASQFTRVSWAEAASNAGERSGEAVGLAPPAADGEVGVLGPYRVQKLLGAGGMGMVYLAEDTALRRPVALKLLRPHLARHPKARDGFLREARVMAALKHDNVVTVYQVSEVTTDGGDAVPFLAMELLDGESLADWVRREGPMPASWVARLGQQAAQGLAAAHARGVLHRDIKPGNLWLEAPPGWSDLPPDRRPPLASVARLKILDFGLAQQVGADGDESAGFGTPAYMPPEHARGESLSPSADLFSLGVVLYELTTGRLPFAAKDRSGIPTYARPPDIRASAPDAPAELAEVVQNLLQFKPRDRTLSAREVAERLAALAELASAETRQMANATVPIARPRSSRRWSRAAMLISALVAGGALLAIQIARGPMTSESGTPTPQAGTDAKFLGPPDDEWCRLVGELPVEQQLGAVLDKLRELNPGFNGQANVQIAAGELRTLSIATDHVSDIRPIRACVRLQKLECNGSARDKGLLSDLSPIRGLPLIELNCWWNRELRDMSPIRGMALKSSQIGETPVEDLSPFAGMPLTTLSVNGCPLQTLDIVRELPQLRFLNCIDCPVRTLEPLGGRDIQHLAFTFQAERGDADVLNRMPRLTQINWIQAKEFRQKNNVPEPGR